VLRTPMTGVAGIRGAPGLFAVAGVLLGSTAYDSLSNDPWWVRAMQDSSVSPALFKLAGLVVVVVLVTGAFAAAAALSGLQAGVPRHGIAGEFAHTLVPIIVGYFIAHYWSLLVIAGQQTFIQLSDPLGGGSNWLGTGDNEVDATLAQARLVATIQVASIVTGHILGVVLAHDRAVRLFPRRNALRGQVPLLVLMVGYTLGGLWLLWNG
jgi:hypothetical protein